MIVFVIHKYYTTNRRRNQRRKGKRKRVRVKTSGGKSLWRCPAGRFHPIFLQTPTPFDWCPFLEVLCLANFIKKLHAQKITWTKHIINSISWKIIRWFKLSKQRSSCMVNQTGTQNSPNEKAPYTTPHMLLCTEARRLYR